MSPPPSTNSIDPLTPNDQEVAVNERVKVYRNTNRGCWSILGTDNKLLLHADALVLKDCKFTVQPAGRERVVPEGKKNVHAFVTGVIVPIIWHHQFREKLERVIYNPIRYDHFIVESDQTEISKSKCCLFNNDGRLYGAVT